MESVKLIDITTCSKNQRLLKQLKNKKEIVESINNKTVPYEEYVQGFKIWEKRLLPHLLVDI